eukprot:10294351-Prorocentrum_lima.AAC.1
MKKGSYWAGTVSHTKRANVEIADEECEEMRSGSWVSKTQKKHKMRVLQRAQHLAEAFIDLLREEDCKFLKVFAAAGWRMDLTNKAYEEFDVKYNIFLNDPSEQNQDVYNGAEE